MNGSKLSWCSISVTSLTVVALEVVVGAWLVVILIVVSSGVVGASDVVVDGVVVGVGVVVVVEDIVVVITGPRGTKVEGLVVVLVSIGPYSVVLGADLGISVL